jgi:hypothetical protein
MPGAALGSAPLDESPLLGEAPLPGAHLVAIGRHPKDDMTDKIDFKSFPAIGTELSHFFSSSSTGWGAARFSFGGRRRTRFARFAGSTSIASSPLSSIHLEAISIPNWPSSWIHPEDVLIADRSGLPVLGRRLARVFGLFQARMSNRVAEEGVKSPQKPAKWVRGVERMMLNAGLVESFVVKQPLAENIFSVCYGAVGNYQVDWHLDTHQSHPHPMEGKYLTPDPTPSSGRGANAQRVPDRLEPLPVSLTNPPPRIAALPLHTSPPPYAAPSSGRGAHPLLYRPGTPLPTSQARPRHIATNDTCRRSHHPTPNTKTTPHPQNQPHPRPIPTT